MKTEAIEMCSYEEPVEMLKYKLLTKEAFAPIRATELAAGIDLRSPIDITIQPGKNALVPSDLAFSFPAGTYGRVAGRSGLALKKKITVGGGVIDADYTGNVKVILFNLGEEPFEIKRGDRFAQLICERVCYPIVSEMSKDEEEILLYSMRGEGGFGSTGTC